MIEDLNALLAAASEIEQQVSAIRRGSAAAAACLRDIADRLRDIGLPIEKLELVAASADDLACVAEFAHDINIRVKRACEIQRALAGREVGHA
jgi:hypothetical protein